MLAMHKPPVKSALKRSQKISQKKASFATFQAYDACKGYKCPVSQEQFEAFSEAGYSFQPSELVVQPPPAPVQLRWTSSSPPITFGSFHSVQPIPSVSGGDLISNPVDSGRAMAIRSHFPLFRGLVARVG